MPKTPLKDPHSAERQLFQLQKKGFEDVNKGLEKLVAPDLSGIQKTLEEIRDREVPEIPEAVEAVTVKNQLDLKTLEEGVSGVIKAIEDKKFAGTDTTEIKALLQDILNKKDAETDLSPVVAAVNDLTKFLKNTPKTAGIDYTKDFKELARVIMSARPGSAGFNPGSVGINNVAGTPVNVATSENQSTANISLANIEASETTIISHLANGVSTVNSSSTPLGISGVFTGTAEDISKYASVSVSVFSDRTSASNGLSIQFSVDGTNWDNIDAHTIVANVAHVTTNAVQYKYFRVVYTNGTTAQTSFRLQTIYATESVGPIIEEMGGDVSDTTSALTTKSVLFAKNPAGVYGSINRTTGGNLKVSIEEVTPGVVFATSSASYDTLIEDASATITYIGKAVAGTATSSASWQIKRINTASGTAVRFADGVSTFTKVWTSRASYTYI